MQLSLPLSEGGMAVPQTTGFPRLILPLQGRYKSEVVINDYNLLFWSGVFAFVSLYHCVFVHLLELCMIRLNCLFRRPLGVVGLSDFSSDVQDIFDKI